MIRLLVVFLFALVTPSCLSETLLSNGEDVESYVSTKIGENDVRNRRPNVMFGLVLFALTFCVGHLLCRCIYCLSRGLSQCPYELLGFERKLLLMLHIG